MSSAPRLVRASLYVLVAAVAIQVAHAFLGLAKGELLTRVIEDWLYNGVLIGAALVCVARAVLVREERLAWSLIGFGLVAWSAADLYYTLVLVQARRPALPVDQRRRLAALLSRLLDRRRPAHAPADPRVPRQPVARRDRRRAWAWPRARRARAAADPRHERGGRAARRGHQPRLSGRRRPAAGADGRRAGAHRLAARPARSRWWASALVLSGVADIVLPRARSPTGSTSRPPGCLVVARVGGGHRDRRLAAGGPGAPTRLEGRRLLVLPLGAMVAALVLLLVDHFDRVSDLAAAWPSRRCSSRACGCGSRSAST